MKKILYLFPLLAVLSFTTSCKKSYQCDCTTITSNNSGSGSTSTTTKDSYASTNMTHKQAEDWCNQNEQSGELDGGQHINTTCVLTK